ncbi:ribonuclease H-like domain-containing protein [Tanacetum coccineum]|uniref:Ribonuclease H-like domain-containing protein n=1 Tax=Tanacetum coccineum TaxID=301880 RepID=A0ABQ5DWU3_9ASTR
MAGSQDDIPPPPLPSPSQTSTQQTPHTVSTIKLPILKKGEYDIWAMKMEHYLAHTDYPIWEVIQNGNGHVSITTDTQGQIKVLPPRTAEEILARERERKARTTLLMSLPEDHLVKFHKMTDAKEMWDAIKSRFGGNDESKKMQKYIPKQQFEGLSLPSAWSQVSLIMRTNPGVDSLSFDDLYNNLRVFESDIKGSTASSSSTQNVAFVSENTSSTNDVSTAYGFSNSSGSHDLYENEKVLQKDNNMDSSMGKICLGKDVIEISSGRNKGSGDWDLPECKDTEGSGGKKELEALILLHSANAIVNFEEGTITIQPDFDPFLLSSNEEGNPNLDDLETLIDFDFDEVPQTKTDLPPMEYKMGKGSRNKKKVMENIMYFNMVAGHLNSNGNTFNPERKLKRALAHNISMRYEILEEVRPVIETLAYNDKYRKLLDEIWADKVRLDGMIKPEEEKAMAKMKGHMLKEKKDPGAFIFPIRLEGRINENALADIGSDTNAMPYRIYEQLGRDDIMKEDRNIIMINYTEAEVTGRLVNVLCQVGFTTLSAKFLILEIHVDRDAPIVVGHGFLDTIGGNIDIPNRIFTTFDGHTRQTFRAAKFEKSELYSVVISLELRPDVLRGVSASFDEDLYERMGIMEIRQEAIERMEYRHAYHWDRYQGVFEHMEGVYSVLLQGAYNPPGYAQPQYDQCFQ